MTQLGSAAMSNVIHNAIALRRKNPAPPGERLLLDVLLENDFTGDVIFADAMTYVVGGFHTIGYGTFSCLIICYNHFATTNPPISTWLVQLPTWRHTDPDSDRFRQGFIQHKIYLVILH